MFTGWCCGQGWSHALSAMSTEKEAEQLEISLPQSSPTRTCLHTHSDSTNLEFKQKQSR